MISWSLAMDERMAALEPTSTGRRGTELRNTWQRRSSIQQGGEARGHVLCGSTGAHLNKEVRSGAVGHVAAAEPTSTGRCDPKLQLT
jgi:threonine dehydrogenase-like Zn-dependent dehydrogenase